ncbi:hypothetical protein [Microbaculum sp. FT89]|uniref:hypothetical protein n=1 Tax=Microbaculum sp. FT89 TaxID=3447298 RepID=UPI003F5382EB
MPDFENPEAQSAALAFAVLCATIGLIGGGLADDPALTLKADGLMAVLAALYLVFRADPGGGRLGDVLPLHARQTGNRRRHGVSPRVRAHLWFAQWMAALAMFSLALSMFVA